LQLGHRSPIGAAHPEDPHTRHWMNSQSAMSLLLSFRCLPAVHGRLERRRTTAPKGSNRRPFVVPAWRYGIVGETGSAAATQRPWRDGPRAWEHREAPYRSIRYRRRSRGASATASSGPERITSR
jgi:hypothetical protein